MATNLFVGGLAYTVTDDELREAFEVAGTVTTARVIVDKFSNRSKGFGFVEMGSDEEAKKAIDELNGKEISGRAIAVSEARPQEKREPRSFGGDSGGGGGYNRDNRGGGRDRY